MKRVIPIIAALAGAGLISIAVILVMLVIDIRIQTMKFFIFIPLGSFFTGWSSSYFYAISIRILEINKSPYDFWFLTFTGLITALFIYLLEYRVALTDLPEYLSVLPGAYQIGSMKSSGNGNIGFFNYIGTSVSSRQIVFFNYGIQTGTLSGSAVLSWLDFIPELIGYPAGSWTWLPTLTSKRNVAH